MESSETRDVVTTFMHDNGFDDIVKKFCNGIKVREHAKKEFDLLQEYLGEICEEAQDNLKNLIKREFGSYTFEMLIEDLELMLKAHIYGSIRSTLELSDAFAFRAIVIENAKQAIDEDNHLIVDWINRTCEEVIKDIKMACHIALSTHTFSKDLIEDIKKLIDGMDD